MLLFDLPVPNRVDSVLSLPMFSLNKENFNHPAGATIGETQWVVQDTVWYCQPATHEKKCVHHILGVNLIISLSREEVSVRASHPQARTAIYVSPTSPWVGDVTGEWLDNDSALDSVLWECHTHTAVPHWLLVIQSSALTCTSIWLGNQLHPTNLL